ncbi:ATP-binding protein [Streptomyces goshikiensis]
MNDPQPANPNVWNHLRAGIAQHAPHIQPGPIDDAPTPNEPGHPDYHRARRAEWALARWHTATPPRYRHADATHPDVQAWADRVINDPTTAGNLLLIGTTGTGKTHQAFGALRRIAAAGPAPKTYEIRAITAADMYGLLRPKGSERGAEEELKRLCRVPLLVLDDLGAAKASEWVEDITGRLINNRYNAALPTLYTSNLPAQDPTGGPDLTKALGDRIVSRLSQDTTVIPMTGPDRRRLHAA